MTTTTQPVPLGTPYSRLESIYALFVEERYRIAPVAGSGLLEWRAVYETDARAVQAAADMTVAMQQVYGTPPVKRTPTVRETTPRRMRPGNWYRSFKVWAALWLASLLWVLIITSVAAGSAAPSALRHTLWD